MVPGEILNTFQGFIGLDHVTISTLIFKLAGELFKLCYNLFLEIDII